MQFVVHDVGHGQCLSLEADNGNTMVWDCGHKAGSLPSRFLPGRITRFIPTNYDEDHLSDLVAVRATREIEILRTNRSVSSAQLRELKLQGGLITPAMDSMINMIDQYTGGAPQPPPEFPNVSLQTFHNNYGDFTDTNNLSLVSVLRIHEKAFLIPGDLGKAGWTKLLQRADFQDAVAAVDVLIASHHGRESGYCVELFDVARRVEVVVFSDSPISCATQEMASTYGNHARGVLLNGQRRSVLSTRNDGSLTWTW